MFSIWLFVLFVCTHGFPVGEHTSELNQVSLGDNVKFDWNLLGDMLQMRLVLDPEVTWVIVGFHKDPFEQSRDEDLALVFIKHKGTTNENIVVKSVHFNEDDQLAASRNELYELDDSTEDSSEIFLYRRVGNLPTTEPITLIWSTGSETTYAGISESYEPHKDSMSIVLSPSNEITKSPPTTTTSTTTTSTTTSTTSTTTTEDYNGVDTEESIPVTQKTTMKNKKTTTTTTSLNSDKSNGEWHDITLPKPTVIPDSDVTTPCPTPKCNCPVVATHWYDKLNDSVYMAIIGASALLTGLVVLCIACCCASGKTRIPKTRKHKVAFYKVDDFDSADEEIEFLKDDDDKDKD